MAENSDNEKLLDDKYLVIRKLGEGGFGNVFLAQDVLIENRYVALKRLEIDSPNREKILIREMEYLSSLSSSHITQFYHHFHDEDDLYLVMEYCPGGSLLKKLILAEPINQDQAIKWVKQLCETLQLVHANKIVHHDLKPENLLFDNEGRIKIADFGVANTRTGTLAYMSPELFMPAEKVSPYDGRIDIYSLGVTLLEILTHRNPFIGLSDEEMLNSKIMQDFIPDDLPEWLKEILLKALHPKPELRFQTMNEFKEALESRHVPYVFSQKSIQAYNAAIQADEYIKRKKWSKALKILDQALFYDPDCLYALTTAGRCELIFKRIDKAEKYFEQAVKLNPRINIQKELGWIYLEKRRYPEAISMLNDHLHREASDYEAYNLLVKAFYLTNRYEAAIDLMNIILKNFNKNNCFENNIWICHMLLGNQLKDFGMINDKENPFLIYNWNVFNEENRSWDGISEGRIKLKSKLLFQEYRFGEIKKHKPNTIILEQKNGEKYQFDDPIIAIGRNPENQLILKENNVSRRHCVILNFVDDVWIYDLESTLGTLVDGTQLTEPLYLDGRHQLIINDYKFSLLTKEGILL